MVKLAFRMLISFPIPTDSSSSCIKGALGGLWKIPNALEFSWTGPHLYDFLTINNVIKNVSLHCFTIKCGFQDCRCSLSALGLMGTLLCYSLSGYCKLINLAFTFRFLGKGEVCCRKFGITRLPGMFLWVKQRSRE